MPPIKFQPKFYVDIYRLSLDGKNKKQIAQILGVAIPTITRWLKRDKAINYAREQGKKDRKKQSENLKERDNPASDFMGYVYGQLDAELKDIFDELNLLDLEESPVTHVERILKGSGKLERQRLLVHAYVHTGFNMSRAMKICNIPKSTLDTWVINDDDFAAVLNEIQWHRKNYVESALFDRIAAGDTKAILFANQCINRDRGFINRVEMRVEEANNVEQDWDLADLDLPLDVLEIVLDAIEKRESESNMMLLEGGK